MRRIALRDIAISSTRPDDGAFSIALEIVSGDADPEARIYAARALGRWAFQPAREPLRTLTEQREIDARVAHEARIAWDRIDLVAMGKVRVAD